MSSGIGPGEVGPELHAVGLAAACIRGKSGMNGGESGSMVSVGGAHLLEEPLEAAARDAQHLRRLLDPVRVQQARGNEAEVALLEQPRHLLAIGQLDEHPDLAVQDEERLVGIGVRVGGNDVAGRTVAVKMPNWPSVSSPLSSTEKVSVKSFACSPSPLLRK